MRQWSEADNSLACPRGSEPRPGRGEAIPSRVRPEAEGRGGVNAQRQCSHGQSCRQGNHDDVLVVKLSLTHSRSGCGRSDLRRVASYARRHERRGAHEEPDPVVDGAATVLWMTSST